jgi:hypothetical protein
MFDIHMLPADHGDCLWIDYGDEAKPRHILIDAGTPGTWPRLRKKIDAERAKNNGKLHFELFVVTHIDADHIGGSIKFLEECGPMGITFGEVWFNGWHQLDNEAPPDVLGAMQGEALTALIDSHNFKWNEKFGRRAVMVPDRGALPSVSYADMRLTLLSPTFEKLQKLKPDWEKEVVKAGLKPGEAFDVEDVEKPSDELGEDVEDMANQRFDPDQTKPNGSSIAFIAEHDGKRVVFGADAHADVLLASLKRGPLAHADALALDVFKIAHHGSKKNISRELIEALPAKRYLVSTSGAIFGHPNPEAIARIAVFGPENKALDFNYRTEFNKEWDSKSRKLDWGLTTRYGDEEKGLLVRL